MSERYGRDEENGYVADMSITETIDGIEYGEEVEDVVAELNALNVRVERAEEFARVCNAKTQSYLEQLAVEMARVKELESFLGGLADWCHGHFTDLIAVGLGEIERVLREEER